jgi:hypothetical protein
VASVSNPLRSVLQNLSKKWAFAGASLGIAVPVAIRVYEVVQLSTVPAAVKYLFWPTLLIVINSFEYPAALLLLSLLGNALLFGAVAGALRRGFIFVLFILAMSAWLLLPPSDAVLRRRFEQQQALLQQVVEMSKQDSEIVRITFAQFEVVNGKLYGSGDGEMVLPSHRWGEYTRNLRKLHMSEAAFNRSGSGEVYIGSQTFGVGGIRSYYGYVYCPEPSTIFRSYLPCTEGNDSGGWNSFRYERLHRNWYIYKVSGPYYIE